MIVELSYLLLALALVIYSLWRYSRRREKGLLYLATALALLFLSLLFHQLSTTWWFYIAVPVLTFRHLELVALGFFACFAIAAIMAVREMQKTETKQATQHDSP